MVMRASPDEPRRPTLREIALRANLSRASVSIILGNPGTAAERFRPETIERVRRIAAEVGYQTNLMAVSLKKFRSPFFGLILRGTGEVDAISWHHQAFEGQFQAGVVTAARVARLFPVVATQDAPEGIDVWGLVREVLDGGVCAAVLRTPVGGIEAAIHERMARGFPMVVVFPDQPDRYASNVIDMDNAAGGRRAAELLHAAGRTRWVLIRDQMPREALALREQGMAAVAVAAGARLEVLAIPDGFGELEILHWLVPLLSDLRPDGIYAASSVAAVGALLACQQAGLRVPEDTCLVGCDASLWRASGCPAITSIDVSWHAVGELAVQRMVELQKQGRSTFESVKLPPHVRRGGTCPGGDHDPPRIVGLA
jgi:DNA-binding LacI/PurR family transcriptional regulator